MKLVVGLLLCLFSLAWSQDFPCHANTICKDQGLPIFCLIGFGHGQAQADEANLEDLSDLATQQGQDFIQGLEAYGDDYPYYGCDGEPYIRNSSLCEKSKLASYVKGYLAGAKCPDVLSTPSQPYWWQDIEG